MPHLAKKLPYETTTIAPEMTKAEIDAMLHEFVILDNSGKRVCEVKAIRWTDLPPSLPMLEFMVQYIHEGVQRTTSVRIQPPLLMKRVRRQGYGMVNAPAPSQSMRMFYWYLKSKLEAILFGLNDVTKEFLDSVLVSLPGGRVETVSDIIIEQIKRSEIPALLPPQEKKQSNVIEMRE